MVLEASGNRWLANMLGGVNDLLILARRPLSSTHSGVQARKEHSAVIEALEKGDAEAAESAMRHHIDRVRDDILAHISTIDRNDAR